jgi:hypothetical protein
MGLMKPELRAGSTPAAVVATTSSGPQALRYA